MRHFEVAVEVKSHSDRPNWTYTMVVSANTPEEATEYCRSQGVESVWIRRELNQSQMNRYSEDE